MEPAQKPRRVGVFVTLALLALVLGLHAMRERRRASRDHDDGYHLLVRAERAAEPERAQLLQQAEEAFVRGAGSVWLDATALAAASLVPGLRAHLGEPPPPLPADVTLLTEAQAIAHGRALMERGKVSEFLNFLAIPGADRHARVLAPFEVVARRWLAARSAGVKPTLPMPWRPQPAGPGG